MARKKKKKQVVELPHKHWCEDNWLKFTAMTEQEKKNWVEIITLYKERKDLCI